jgi:integrase
MKTASLEVKNYRHSSKTPFMIDVRKYGQGRLFFKTETAAKQELARIKTKIAREGQDALNLSDSLRVMVLQGEATLKPYGKTITDAVAYYIKHLEATKKSITVRALVDEYLAMQKSRKKSSGHQKDLRLRCERFCLTFGSRLMHEITSKEIEKWLFSLQLGPVSFNNYRDRIGFLFGYAIKHGYMEKDTNPVDDRIEKMLVPNEPVEIFAVNDLVRVLEHATPKLLPIFAIGAFAGLRTSELLQLKWEDLNFVTGYLDVRAEIAKSARSRFFKLEPNLLAWLAPYAGNTGLLWDGNEDAFIYARRAVCKAAGIKWVDNGLRHSYASYFFAKYQNQNVLAYNLGHKDTDLIYSNYRAVVKIPDEGDRFFNLMPSAPDNVVPMVPAA